MVAINKEQILSKTHYGLAIYSHILREYYPEQTVLSLSGRTCSPTKNPFNADKSTLNIFIQKEQILGNALDKETTCHYDTQNAIPAGDAFDFAELHYKQSGDELLKTLNKEMNLHIGEKMNFYSHNKVASNSPQSPISRQVEVEKKEVSFSFYKSPIKNTVPHKSATLLQIYNAITGDFYKERTDKLRSIADPKQARHFKANNFDYCTFSGTFSSRNDKNLMQHSGLLAIDFDHLPNLSEVCQALLADEYFDTQLLFISPSGDGLKWIIPIDTSTTPHSENLNERAQNSNPFGVMPSEVKFAHSEYFAAVANYILQTYSIEVDKSGRDVSRACFLAHDPNAFINPLIRNDYD